MGPFKSLVTEMFKESRNSLCDDSLRNRSSQDTTDKTNPVLILALYDDILTWELLPNEPSVPGSLLLMVSVKFTTKIYPLSRSHH